MDFTGIGNITNVFGLIAWVFTATVWGVVEVTRRRNGNGKARSDGTAEAAVLPQPKGKNGIVTEDQLKAVEATWNGKLAKHELYCVNSKRALEAIEAVRADLRDEIRETKEVVVRLESRVNGFLDNWRPSGQGKE